MSDLRAIDTRVFVYGTLRRGEKRHAALANARFVGEGTVSGFVMYEPAGYPGIVEGDGIIVGEVYAVDAATLRSLDHIEAVEEGLSRRECAMIELNDGRTLKCELYLYNRGVVGCTAVPSGDWLMRD